MNQCRPLNAAQGNVIKWFKRVLTDLPPSTTREPSESLIDFEDRLKKQLDEQLQNFLRDNISSAARSISLFFAQKIGPREVILTYGLYPFMA